MVFSSVGRGVPRCARSTYYSSHRREFDTSLYGFTQYVYANLRCDDYSKGWSDRNRVPWGGRCLGPISESGCEIRHPLYTEPSLPGKGLKLRGPDPGHASSLSAYSYSSHTAVNGTSQDTPRGRGGFRVQLCKLYILTFDPAQVPLGSTIPRYSLHVGTRFGLCRPAQPHAAAAGPRISTPIATSHPHRRSSQRRSNRLIERPRSRTCRVSPAHLCPTSQVRAAT